ncbi:UNKNOWN [Stylonychia lemnae]|uniref:Uncharacterized protein n=1 Tax=Stylonychia lemnae TaxID=5949 RepID=A0A078AZE3_STYLE|nr:UNKNOWN [Stylonychia lemnae]|eukprot:CDW87519.1 UNKNOWN [Stylonychia lemnae]
MATGQDESVKQLFKQLKEDLRQIQDSEEQYDRAGTSAKIKIVQEAQVLVNSSRLNIRNLEFEIKMLPEYSRGDYMQKFRNIQQQYEESRKIFFKLEDNMNTEVFKKSKIGGVQEDEKRPNKDIRSRLLNGVEDIYDQEQQLQRIKIMGQETYMVMKDANNMIFKDREGLYRMIENQDIMSQDIDHAHGVIVGIERTQFIRKCLLYLIATLLFLANCLLIVYKVLY